MEGWFMQPMVWRDDWPVMGADPDGDGRGEPVPTFRKPGVKTSLARFEPQTTDEFDAKALGPQWQWQASPGENWLSLEAKRGSLRLFAQPAPAADSLWLAPNLLMQKWTAPEFVATTRLEVGGAVVGETAGLVVFGLDYAWIGVTRNPKGYRLAVKANIDARSGGGEKEIAGLDFPKSVLYLRASIVAGGRVRFSHSADNRRFTPLGDVFTAKPGHWIGAKIGFFAIAPPDAARTGHVDIDWFRVAGPAS